MWGPVRQRTKKDPLAGGGLWGQVVNIAGWLRWQGDAAQSGELTSERTLRSSALE